MLCGSVISLGQESRQHLSKKKWIRVSTFAISTQKLARSRQRPRRTLYVKQHLFQSRTRVPASVRPQSSESTLSLSPQVQLKRHLFRASCPILQMQPTALYQGCHSALSPPHCQPFPSGQWPVTRRPAPDTHHTSFISVLTPHAPLAPADSHGLNGQNMKFSLCYLLISHLFGQYLTTLRASISSRAK